MAVNNYYSLIIFFYFFTSSKYKFSRLEIVFVFIFFLRVKLWIRKKQLKNLPVLISFLFVIWSEPCYKSKIKVSLMSIKIKCWLAQGVPKIFEPFMKCVSSVLSVRVKAFSNAHIFHYGRNEPSFFFFLLIFRSFFFNFFLSFLLYVKSGVFGERSASFKISDIKNNALYLFALRDNWKIIRPSLAN